MSLINRKLSVIQTRLGAKQENLPTIDELYNKAQLELDLNPPNFSTNPIVYHLLHENKVADMIATGLLSF